MVSDGEKWLKSGQFAEVLVEGTTPKAIVCDCGSPSVPRNHERARAIAALPEMLRFLQVILERSKIVEKMNRNEVHAVIPIADYNRMISCLKACGLKSEILE